MTIAKAGKSCCRAGANYALCRSLADVEQALETAGIPVFARTANTRVAA